MFLSGMESRGESLKDMKRRKQQQQQTSSSLFDFSSNSYDEAATLPKHLQCANQDGIADQPLTSNTTSNGLTCNTTPSIDPSQEFEMRKVLLVGACRKACVVLHFYLQKVKRSNQCSDIISASSSEVDRLTMKERIFVKTQVQLVTKEIRVLEHLYDYFFKGKSEDSDKLEKELKFLGQVVKQITTLNDEFTEAQNCKKTPTSPSTDFVSSPSTEQQDLKDPEDALPPIHNQIELSSGIKLLIEKREKKEQFETVINLEAREKYLKDIGLLKSEYSSGLSSL